MVTEFFAGLQGLGFWQWIGLIMLTAAARGLGPILAGGTRNTFPDKS